MFSVTSAPYFLNPHCRDVSDIIFLFCREISLVFCNISSDWWHVKPEPQPTCLCKLSGTVLDMPLVVEKVLEFFNTSELRTLRLVNRTWNREATRYLQKQQNDYVKFTVPYNGTTFKFLQLADSARALEQETNIQWRWSFSKVQLTYIFNLHRKLYFAVFEQLLRTLSSQITVLDLENFYGVEIEGFPESPPVLTFPCLRELTGPCSEQLANWLLKHTPRLRTLHLYLKPLLPAQYSQFQLTSLYICHLELSQKFLKALAAFLRHHESTLRVFSIYSGYDSKREPTCTHSICLSKLLVLEININAAAILFGPPNKLPCVQTLSLTLDQPNPEFWLSKWNGHELRTVTQLSLISDPVKSDCVPLHVVHAICKVFPNLKKLNLHIRFTKFPQKIFLDAWVPPLANLEELYVKLDGVWQLAAELQNAESALKRVKILTLEYPKGYITSDYCDNIFLRAMPSLRELRLKAIQDLGCGVCKHSLRKMRKVFSVTLSDIKDNHILRKTNLSTEVRRHSSSSSEDESSLDEILLGSRIFCVFFIAFVAYIVYYWLIDRRV